MFITEANACTERSTSVVSPSHVPAPPLLNDPLPVVNHFLGQPNYPAQGAGGGRQREFRAALFQPCLYCRFKTDLSESLLGYDRASGDTA